MQQTTHTTVRDATHGDSASAPADGTFTRRVSVALIAGYSLFSIALVSSAPFMADTLAVWLLWVVVGIMSIVTFGIGMLKGRTAERFNHPVLNTQSRRMQRWMKS